MDIRKLHEIEQSIADAEQTVPMVTDLLFLYYSHLVTSGFTDEQALYLVMEHGTTLGVKGGQHE